MSDMVDATQTLSSICSLIVDCPHSTPAWTDSGFIVLRNQNIKNGKLDLSSPSFTDEAHFVGRNRRAKPSAGDIVITREAPMGEVCMVPEGLECCLGQRQVLLRPNPKVADPRYVLYALQSQSVQHQIGWNEGTGSTVSNLRIPVLEALQIPTPPLEEQRAIAETLGALDDRIDNLRQTNATLQAIAAALFKSRFVDFDDVPPQDMQESELGLIPKGWRVGTLGECCENIRKQARPDVLPPTTPYIGLEHMPRKSIALTEWGVSDGLASSKFWYQRNDILFGKLRPYFHKVGIASYEGVCSTDILVVRAKPHWFGFTAMQLFSDAMISYATQLSNGAKMPRTNWSDIAGYMVVLPPVDAAAKFDDAIRPLVEKMHASIETAATLAALRDTLLPRLISGKLRSK